MQASQMTSRAGIYIKLKMSKTSQM